MQMRDRMAAVLAEVESVEDLYQVLAELDDWMNERPGFLKPEAFFRLPDHLGAARYEAEGLLPDSAFVRVEVR